MKRIHVTDGSGAVSVRAGAGWDARLSQIRRGLKKGDRPAAVLFGGQGGRGFFNQRQRVPTRA